MADLNAQLKYLGPAVNDGLMDARQVGKAILALDSILRKHSSQRKEWSALKPQLKIRANKGSYEILAAIATAAYVADRLGITELSKSYFSEVGKQLALKNFFKRKASRTRREPYD